MLRIITICLLTAWLIALMAAGGIYWLLLAVYIGALHWAASVDGIYPDWIKRWI